MSFASSLASQLVLAPIALPALAAPLAVLLMLRRRAAGVAVSFASCVAVLGVAIALLVLHELSQHRGDLVGVVVQVLLATACALPLPFHLF